MIKEIDITKLKPLNWRWLIALVIAVIVIGIVIGVAMWLKDRVTEKLPLPQTQEPVI